MGVGHLALAEGDLVAAERAFRAVTASTPAFVPAWVNLADVQRMQGREPEVVRTLEAGREAAPDDPALRHALGLALVRARRLPEAVPHLEAAAGHADADPRFTLAWGLYLVDAGQPQRGIGVLEAALARRPYDTDLMLTLLPLRARAGDRAGTLDLLRRLEALRPWDGEVRAERERLENGR
jgi:predicted Zn-dependent protease